MVCIAEGLWPHAQGGLVVQMKSSWLVTWHRTRRIPVAWNLDKYANSWTGLVLIGVGLSSVCWLPCSSRCFSDGSLNHSSVTLDCGQGVKVRPLFAISSACTLHGMFWGDGVHCPLKLQPASCNFLIPSRYSFQSSLTCALASPRAFSVFCLSTEMVTLFGGGSIFTSFLIPSWMAFISASKMSGCGPMLEQPSSRVDYRLPLLRVMYQPLYFVWFLELSVKSRRPSSYFCHFMKAAALVRLLSVGIFIRSMGRKWEGSCGISIGDDCGMIVVRRWAKRLTPIPFSRGRSRASISAFFLGCALGP